jgi:hypothetical protein
MCPVPKKWVALIVAVLAVFAALLHPYTSFAGEAGAAPLRLGGDGMDSARWAAVPGNEAHARPQTGKPKEHYHYDVIVAGTDPEGIAAAVSAARNGLKTLLVDGRNRTVFGGLMTLGWLNSLDISYRPGTSGKGGKHNMLNQGIFVEFYNMIEGTSFDVKTAAKAFERLVRKERNIDVVMRVQSMEPLLEWEDGRPTVKGIRVKKANGSVLSIRARAVIDATQDADIAAQAGVPFTWGREDLGDKNSLMAVTLVFKLKNVTPEVWAQMKRHKTFFADNRSGWGYTEMYDYPSTNPEKVRMRDLNIGRQNDNTVLINSMQIYGVNPLDPQSVAEAFRAAKNELPHVLAYMKERFPEFKHVELAGTAPELYVRESRHMIGEYRLTMVDVLENRDHWDRIAFGSYSVDLQSSSPRMHGSIIMKPQQYAIPFRSIVPKGVDGILVVGRSASFDSLPHGSARTIPVGMATAQAAGAAAKVAIEHGVSFREMSKSTKLVKKLQQLLTEQGMDLRPIRIAPPEYTRHKAYEGLKAAISMHLIAGGHKNDFKLDQPSNPQRFANNLNQVKKVHAAAFPNAFPGSPHLAVQHLSQPAEQKLTLDQAALTICSLLGASVPKAEALEYLRQNQIVTPSTLQKISNPQVLTNGETYLLIKDVLQARTGIVYK